MIDRNLLLVEFRYRWKNVMQLCCRRVEQNGTVSSNSGKFVQGSKNFQLSSIKDHDSSKFRAVVKTAKGFDAREARLSVPPRKVAQQIPSGSAIAKSLQQINNKDREPVTKLHDIVYYIALHGLLLHWRA